MAGIEMDSPIRAKRYRPYRGLPAEEVVAAALAEIEPTETGCIEWPYGRDENGYVRLSVKKKRYLLHRVSWELANGRTVPDGLMVRHHCDNRACFNPEHLDIGTALDNVHDAVKRNRRAIGVRHPRARLSEDEVRSIRTASANGQSMTSLAREYHVTDGTIYFIVQRRTWKHVA